MSGVQRMYWALRSQGYSDKEAREKVAEKFGFTPKKRKEGKTMAKKKKTTKRKKICEICGKSLSARTGFIHNPKTGTYRCLKHAGDWAH